MAYDLMRAYFGGWIKLGATTFGEHFSLKDYVGKRELDAEYNTHNYGTSVHVHFYSNILGVKPAASGFSKITFDPHPGDLYWAKGKVYTPAGMVKVSWKVDGNKFIFDSEVPEGCQYDLKLPKGFKEYKAKVNGKVAVG